MSSSRDHDPSITGGDGAHPVPSHTPGPWRLSRTRRFVMDGLGAPWVAEITQRREFEANACLIAAAPDLLEALRALLRATNFDDNEPWIVQAHAAIAKALGDGLGRAPSPPVNADEIPGNTP